MKAPLSNIGRVILLFWQFLQILFILFKDFYCFVVPYTDLVLSDYYWGVSPRASSFDTMRDSKMQISFFNIWEECSCFILVFFKTFLDFYRRLFIFMSYRDWIYGFCLIFIFLTSKGVMAHQDLAKHMSRLSVCIDITSDFVIFLKFILFFERLLIFLTLIRLVFFEGSFSRGVQFDHTFIFQKELI